MYCFAEAFPDMKEESWINANIHMVQFFGGTTRLLIPDNLKTGIVSNRKHEDPVANKS
jgi:transposase